MKYDMNKLLFSELVYLRDNDLKNSDLYYQELLKRLNFCGFNHELIESIIDHESDILKTIDFKFDKPFIEKKYWLKEHFVSKLTKERDKYGIFEEPIGPKKDTLSTSELLFLDDEMAYILTHAGDIKDKCVLDEIKKFMPNENDAWLQQEFFSRISYYYWLLYNKSKTDELDQCKEIFFRNELQILFINKYNYDDNRWTPYSEEYFERYN